MFRFLIELVPFLLLPLLGTIKITLTNLNTPALLFLFHGFSFIILHSTDPLFMGLLVAFGYVATTTFYQEKSAMTGIS